MASERKTQRVMPRYEGLPIGPEYRSVVKPWVRSGMTLRDLIEREGEGS